MRLLVGPGGVGKSRLAVELGVQLGPSWGVIEVRDDAESDALPRWRAAHRRQVLIVVDYAETRTELASLLEEVAADGGRDTRVLLLARSAGEWWQRLGGGSVRVRGMIAEAGQGIELGPDEGIDSPDGEVARAIPHFAKRVGVASPDEVRVEFGGERPRMLDLHAAALVAVLHAAASNGGQVRVQVGDVLEELLGHEQRFWLQSARAWGMLGGGSGLAPVTVERLVAAGTLLGASDEGLATAVVARVPGRPASMDAARVAVWLRELYPPDEGHEWLGRLRPDRLAELHVTRVLNNAPELLDAWLAGVEERQRRQALVTLARAAQDHVAAAGILERLLPMVVGEVGSVPAARETLAALYQALPYPSDMWAEANALLTRRLADSVQPDADPAERAHWLAGLEVHLGELGRHAEALPLAEEAVTIRRELAATYPDRYRPDLATALHNLSVRFVELGRPTDALPRTQEAVTIRRELVATYPDRYRPDLASSLHNLGVLFSHLGRPTDALPPAEEAITIYRELAA
ncbi:tetratricopeptide repeat protein, partial [Planotetraspora silvatica]